VCVFSAKSVVRLSERRRRVASAASTGGAIYSGKRVGIIHIIERAPAAPLHSRTATRISSSPRPSTRSPPDIIFCGSGYDSSPAVLGQVVPRTSVRSVRHACHGIRESRPCGRENRTQRCIHKWVACYGNRSKKKNKNKLKGHVIPIIIL